MDRKSGVTECGATASVSGRNVQEDGNCVHRFRGFPLVARVYPVSRYCRCCCSSRAALDLGRKRLNCSYGRSRGVAVAYLL